MFTQDEAQDILAKAKAAGATDGDLWVSQGDVFESVVRCGDLEKVRQARRRRMTLRLFCGQRSAVMSTSDFTSSSLASLLSDTCSLARLSPEDPCAGLPEPDQIERAIPCYNLFDSEIGTLSMDEKMNLAKQAEKAAFAADPRITNSDGARVEHDTYTLLYAATNGFSGSYSQTSISLSVTSVASHKGTLQRDYGYSTRRRYKELQSAEAIGRRAALRTVRRLGGRSVATQEVPVVFDPETAASLLSHLISALSGYALYKKASFLAGKRGEKIASDMVTIDDDPTLPGGLGTKPFDGEGLPARKKKIIENGILQSYLLDTYSGKKLGLPSTGNAAWASGSATAIGTGNVHMLPGEMTPDAILQSVPRGLYVTELIGFGVNPVTGDYSQGAAGFWIEKGAQTFPVEEVTIAGNLKEMFLCIDAVGNDLEAWKKIAAPTLRVARMMVAGKGNI